MRLALIPILAFAGCVSMPASTDVLSPVSEPRSEAPAVAAPPPAGDAKVAEAKPAPSTGKTGFDFEKEDRDPNEKVDPKAAEVTPSELFAGLGLGADLPKKPEVTPPPPLPPAPVAPPMVPVDPNTWGVRLLSTVSDATPPRAILGLADGRELVVTPGELVLEARLVVLAIGRDRVQIGQITPDGDHATVRATMLEALYPGGSAAPR